MGGLPWEASERTAVREEAEIQESWWCLPSSAEGSQGCVQTQEIMPRKYRFYFLYHLGPTWTFGNDWQMFYLTMWQIWSNHTKTVIRFGLKQGKWTWTSAFEIILFEFMIFFLLLYWVLVTVLWLNLRSGWLNNFLKLQIFSTWLDSSVSDWSLAAATGLVAPGNLWSWLISFW